MEIFRLHNFGYLYLAQSDFADIREIVPSPSYGLLWIVGGFVVFLLISIFVSIRFRNDLKPVVPETPESASEKARRLLDRLQEKQGDLDSEMFTIEVSMILRSYLEEALELPALEQTTEEFLGDLQRHTWPTAELRENLEEFARIADLVKFARQFLGDDQREQLLASALQVVETTEPQPEILAVS